MADGAANIASYGAWASPVSAASLAESGIGMADLRAVDGVLYWLESRPAEGGRMLAMRMGPSGPEVATPGQVNVRTRVHEYGGAAYLADGGRIWFSQFRDQRLYRQDGAGEAEPLTPEGYRYADLVKAGGGLIGVREDHTDPADVRNTVVRLSGDAGDAGDVLWGEADFVAYPRVSRDGRRLAWIAWNHPNMPWDDTTLYVADLSEAGLANIEAVAGGVGVSAVEPQWGEDGALYYIDDSTGWWNLYRLAAGELTALLPMEAEFAGPLWNFGQSNYALLPDGAVAASYSKDGLDRLVVIRPGAAPAEIELPYSALRSITWVRGSTIALIGAGNTDSGTLLKVDADTGHFEALHQPSPVWLDARYISPAQPISFATGGGEVCHALYFPPTNGDFTAPAGEKPPLIVRAHGGPTSAASPAFSLDIQYWTSRGFALVNVNYRGSSGYGRPYRQRLNLNWGVTDVEDVIAAATYLIERGLVDPKKVAIHGGSAGGFTVLAALTQSDVFKAGGNFYGVADLEALAKDTHKFESRYLDNLIGPYPEAKETYVRRSPIHHLDGFRSPLLILQGAEDPIVPPNQAHMIRDALTERQVPVAYIEFEKEGHGFRRAENIVRAKEAELYFYGRVFGFTPAGELPEVEIVNLATP